MFTSTFRSAILISNQNVYDSGVKDARTQGGEDVYGVLAISRVNVGASSSCNHLRSFMIQGDSRRSSQPNNGERQANDWKYYEASHRK